MNELQIFQNDNLLNLRTEIINGKKEVFLGDTIVDRFFLLSEAANSESKEIAWTYMKLASILFHPLDDETFNTLYRAVATELTTTHIKDEFYYQDLFKRHYHEIRSGKIVNNKTNGKDIPDAWVLRDGFIIPVEVKLNKFDNSALKQLLRYVNAYGSKCGIAVARELTAKLPKNIEFIALSELEQWDLP